MQSKNIIPKLLPEFQSRNSVFFGMWLKITSFCLIQFLTTNLSSQESVSGVPYSVTEKVSVSPAFEVMPAYSQVKKSLKAEQVSDRLKRLEFAHVFDLSLTPENSGEWITLYDGRRIWRLGLASKNAFSLNLIFGTFHLEHEVKIYIYAPDHSYLLGAYSALNNNAGGMLAIEPVPGDSIIIELNIPAEVQNFGELEISKLGHDFMNIFASSVKSSSGMAISGACNADINCDAGLPWQREKYAVCKLIVNARDLCTGTLINNTAQDKTPYVITAHHCIDTTLKAASTVFIFNYEKWKCGGQDGPKPFTLSGSQLIATTPHLDFSLVKIYSLPPFSVHPYFVGWDRSTGAPQRTTTVHHPNGDFKKVSIDENPAVSATFDEDYNPNTHWLVNKWEVGTTERGSSGAPLFNQNHLFVGDLTGGDATCASPLRDYFAKFSNSWADYPESKNQLKHWLDPLNSGAITLQGFDPYVLEKASCDTFRNVASNELTRLYNTNLAWGSYSGHNSQLITQFAEKIDVTGVLKIPGLYMHVAKAYNSSPLSFITIKLWRGGNVPGDEITSRSIYLKDLVVNQFNYLEFDSTIFVSGPVYLGYSVNYSASQDTFALYQSQNRGSVGLSGMHVYKNGLWRNISEITTPAIFSSLSVGLVSCSLINSILNKEIPNRTLKVYPNPVSSGYLIAEVPSDEDLIITVYDISGRKANLSYKLYSNRIEINTEGLMPGVYMLRVLVPGIAAYNAKFMVIQ